MRRLFLVFATACASALVTACGAGEVVVQAQVEGEAGEGEQATARPLGDLVIRLLPYDRDVIFDSLEAAYPEPEPPIPDSLAQIQEMMAQAQTEWQRAESRWNAVRDSLKAINDALQGLSRSSAQYVALFRDFQDLEPQEQRLQRASESGFRRFEDLQARVGAQTEQLRLQRQEWADQAFTPVDSVITARLEQLGREEYTDTTDASGLVRFRLPAGQWWVYARYELPYHELYWNVPVEVAGGEPAQVQLTRQNAQIRPKL